MPSLRERDTHKIRYFTLLHTTARVWLLLLGCIAVPVLFFQFGVFRLREELLLRLCLLLFTEEPMVSLATVGSFEGEQPPCDCCPKSFIGGQD